MEQGNALRTSICGEGLEKRRGRYRSHEKEL